MSILALDPGLTTGWAAASAFAADPREPGLAGSHQFSEKMMDHGALGDLFGRWLTALMRARQCTRLVIEGQFSTGTASDQYLHGLTFVAHITAHRLGVPRFEISPAGWKKAAIGKGDATKAEVTKAMRAAGWHAPSEHGFDAAALLVAYRLRLEKP